jgi:hypothetical protein
VNRKLATGFVVVALLAGCGGSGGGSDKASTSGHSAGDRQYVDPFQTGAGGDKCLSKAQVKQQIDRIQSRDVSAQRKQQAIRTVRKHAC